jgi:hypothetical protein
MGNNPQLTNIIWLAEMRRPDTEGFAQRRVSRKGAKEERKDRKGLGAEGKELHRKDGKGGARGKARRTIRVLALQYAYWRRQESGGSGIHASLAQASACALPDGKRPLPAARLTRFDQRIHVKDQHRWEVCL